MAGTRKSTGGGAGRAPKARGTLAPKAGGGGDWRALRGGALAAFLLARPTIADAAWAGAARRRAGETRADFVVRLCGAPDGPDAGGAA